jgi:acyl-CoA thioesterase-1
LATASPPGSGWTIRRRKPTRRFSRKNIVAARLPYHVINGGLSGETTAAGLRRIDWMLRERVDVFVLALGGNDGLRGILPPVTRANLTGILEKVRAKYPDAKLVVAGMQMPPNLGPDYLAAYRAVFPEVAKANRGYADSFPARWRGRRA